MATSVSTHTDRHTQTHTHTHTHTHTLSCSYQPPHIMVKAKCPFMASFWQQAWHPACEPALTLPVSAEQDHKMGLCTCQGRPYRLTPPPIWSANLTSFYRQQHSTTMTYVRYIVAQPPLSRYIPQSLGPGYILGSLDQSRRLMDW